MFNHMFKTNITRAGLVLLSAVIVLSACRKRPDVSLPDNLVTFETSAQGLSSSENSISVKVKLSRGTDKDIPVTINVTPQNAVYGTDFTTVPATNASGQIVVTIPSGNNEASFTVSKVPGVLYDGNEKIVFDLYSSASPILIGASKQFTLTFAELIATSASATIDGGGATFPNKVFIDLSANRQVPVLRTNWDLGFYTGPDYRVILNSSVGMMAKQIAKNDLSQVTAADTIGFSVDVAFSQFAPTTSSLAYIDYPDGDLTKTAIAAVSATATDNKVYIINRGFGVGTPAAERGWKKVRIIRNAAGGYTLQYADIAAATFSSVDISKDDAYFFKYVSLSTGAVSVEPEKKKWDIAWTYFSNVTNFGTGEVPYLFQDIILQNRNVSVAKVLVTTRAYADFSEADLSTLTFSSVQTAIGSDWRSGGGPGSAPSIRTDRYYVIKDGDNNYYKLRFTALTQNGERGYPAFEVTLVKRGG
jgi:hypothetical protein